MNIILVLLSLVCIVLLGEFLYRIVVSIYNVVVLGKPLPPKDDSSSANVSPQNVVTPEPETSTKPQASLELAPKKTTIDLATKNIPARYVVVADETDLNPVRKRVLVSDDFIHWIMSFRKKDVFVTMLQKHKNPAAIELISLFSSGASEALALELPNNTDLMVVKLLIDSTDSKSVVMYSSLPVCPVWALAFVDAAAKAAALAKIWAQRAEDAAAAEKIAQEALQERQKAANTPEMQKLFQATYDALSAENKQDYAEWGSERKLEDGDLASCIFLAHWACEYDVAACLEMLKAGGANFDIQDTKGYTPAHYAAENDYVECLEVLRAGGANFNIQDNNGQTPAHCVPREGIESLGILKAGGADFNIKDDSGQTLVHYATTFCSDEFLDELKACGANFDIPDKRGNAPAHIAAENGSAGRLKKINDFGVNFNLQNKNGDTPAHLALEGADRWVPLSAKYEACLQVLKACGANFDIQDNKGQTAREIALKRGIKIDDL